MTQEQLLNHCQKKCTMPPSHSCQSRLKELRQADHIRLIHPICIYLTIL